MGIYIGIDPGISGGIAALDGAGKIILVEKFGDKTERDISDLVAYYRGLTEPFAYIEMVHSMPKQGVKSTFTFGRNFGVLIGSLYSHRIPFDFVLPLRWQTYLGFRSKGNKNINKAMAQRLFPDHKCTHATSDALLIAEYCRRLKTQSSSKSLSC